MPGVPADDQVFVAGSYSWAAVVVNVPPTTKTFPFCNSIVEGSHLPAVIVPAEDQAFVTGLYNSALARALPVVLPPPTTNTLPLGSRVDPGNQRGVAMEAAADHVSVAGLYNSAVAWVVLLVVPEYPPATNTWPLASKVVEGRTRTLTMAAGVDQLPAIVSGAGVIFNPPARFPVLPSKPELEE